MMLAIARALRRSKHDRAIPVAYILALVLTVILAVLLVIGLTAPVWVIAVIVLVLWGRAAWEIERSWSRH